MGAKDFLQDGYIYLEIPEAWLCTYHKLLHYLADFGEDALKNCETSCSGKNKNILKCWGMFQSAIAAKSIGDDKLANVLIKYIDNQLELLYTNTNEEVFNSAFILPIDENGYVKGLNSCGNNIEFYLHNPLDEPVTTEDVTLKPGYLYVRIGEKVSKEFYINDDLLYMKEEI